MDMSAGLSSIRVSSESKQGSKFDQMGRAYKQVSIQYNCTKFYSFILLISCDNTDYRGRPLALPKNWTGIPTQFNSVPQFQSAALSEQNVILSSFVVLCELKDNTETVDINFPL